MRERSAARVLLLDEDDRLLLIHSRAYDPAAPTFWYSVGGGLEPGESVIEAARRETLEETGIEPRSLGPIVWRDEQLINSLEDGKPLLLKETYILARCHSAPLNRARWTDLERSFVLELRWWSVADLCDSTETIYPRGLADLLVPLLAGVYPDPPLRL